MSAKPWWESKTVAALVVVVVGAGLLIAGAHTASDALTTAGTTLLALAAPAAIAMRAGATQPLTLTKRPKGQGDEQ